MTIFDCNLLVGYELAGYLFQWNLGSILEGANQSKLIYNTLDQAQDTLIDFLL